jgi:catechol 2,3-dioxygenase-like lactoylglutathione lyase family enzyme
MFKDTAAFSGYAVDDLAAAHGFYTDTLGVETTEPNEHFFELKLGGGGTVLIYGKPDYKPATYTVLNFPVEDVETAVDALSGRGIEFERYDGMNQDEKGIERGPEGPAIAWFTDPAGNIISVLQP